MTGPDISIIEDARALSRNLGINVAHIIDTRDDAQRECEAWKQRALKAEATVHAFRQREADRLITAVTGDAHRGEWKE